MIFESRCQKVIPTYLRIRMGRRSVTPSHTWPAAIDVNSKISIKNSWKDRCPNDIRMDCNCHSLEWHTQKESHMDKSTANSTDHGSSCAMSINDCRSIDGGHQHEIKQNTKHSHSILNEMMVFGSRKTSHISHMKSHKVTNLHRTHKRIESTSKLHTHTFTNSIARAY